MSKKKFTFIPRVVIRGWWDWLSILFSFVFYWVAIYIDLFLGSLLLIMYIFSALIIANLVRMNPSKDKNIKRNVWDYIVLVLSGMLLGLPFFTLGINYRLWGGK